MATSSDFCFLRMAGFHYALLALAGLTRMKRRPLPPTRNPQRRLPPAKLLDNPLARPVWICFLLAAITAAVYWPAVSFDFVNYDDPEFITLNPHVLGGLTWENVRWAFSASLGGSWMPLTWLSLYAGCGVVRTHCRGTAPDKHRLACDKYRFDLSAVPAAYRNALGKRGPCGYVWIASVARRIGGLGG